MFISSAGFLLRDSDALNDLNGLNILNELFYPIANATTPNTIAPARAQAARRIAFGEQPRAHRRADENADLARRRDVAHRSKLHRRKHENVGERYQTRRGDRFIFMLAPFDRPLASEIF